jgi:hypothetical protein
LSDIQNENAKLGVRAAIAYTDLTPRFEKFREVF